MKTETAKKMVKCFVFLAYLGVIIISLEIGYSTHAFTSNGVFSTAPLHGLVLFYGYLFGGLVLMMWLIKNRDLLERKAVEEQLRKRRTTKNGLH